MQVHTITSVPARSVSIPVTCETCGKEFWRKRSAIRANVYCSHACRLSAPPAPAIVCADGVSARLPLQRRDGSISGYAMIDVADIAWVQQWRWQLNQVGRVQRGKGGQTFLLHRELMGLSFGDKREVDHFDRDPLNNRRGNLRITTRAQNAQNLPLRKGTSRHRGVSWDSMRQMWHALVYVDHVRHDLGFFDDESEAAKAARDGRLRLMPYAID